MVKEQIRTTHMKLFINKRTSLGVSATEYYLLLHSIARGTLSLPPIDTYLYSGLEEIKCVQYLSVIKKSTNEH